MSDVTITIGAFTLTARFETEAAPKTCAVFRSMLPLEGQLLHVRWSGQAVWLPMGDLSLQMPPENATSYPAVGDIVIYPGGISETEILIPYGAVRFASRAGSSPAITSSRSCPASSTCARSAGAPSGRARSGVWSR